jgi:hypothetical protein
MAAISASVALLIMIYLLSLAANKGTTQCFSRLDIFCEIIDLVKVCLMKLAIFNSKLLIL